MRFLTLMSDALPRGNRATRCRDICASHRCSIASTAVSRGRRSRDSPELASGPVRGIANYPAEHKPIPRARIFESMPSPRLLLA